MTIPRRDILNLYKSLLRHGARFSDYNFREYAQRRTRDAFRANRAASGADAVKMYEEGVKQLDVVKRQTAIGQMYKADPVIIDAPKA